PVDGARREPDGGAGGQFGLAQAVHVERLQRAAPAGDDVRLGGGGVQVRGAAFEAVGARPAVDRHPRDGGAAGERRHDVPRPGGACPVGAAGGEVVAGPVAGEGKDREEERLRGGAVSGPRPSPDTRVVPSSPCAPAWKTTA